MVRVQRGGRKRMTKESCFVEVTGLEYIIIIGGGHIWGGWTFHLLCIATVLPQMILGNHGIKAALGAN